MQRGDHWFLDLRRNDLASGAIQGVFYQYHNMYSILGNSDGRQKWIRNYLLEICIFAEHFLV